MENESYSSVIVEYLHWLQSPLHGSFCQLLYSLQYLRLVWWWCTILKFHSDLSLSTLSSVMHGYHLKDPWKERGTPEQMMVLLIQLHFFCNTTVINYKTNFNRSTFNFLRSSFHSPRLLDQSSYSPHSVTMSLLFLLVSVVSVVHSAHSDHADKLSTDDRVGSAGNVCLGVVWFVHMCGVSIFCGIHSFRLRECTL